MMYNPFTVIMNGSFDVLQFEGETKHLDMVRYRSGGRQVMHNLTSPFSVVSRFGTSKFIRQELLPLSFTSKKMQWWPNYNLHLLGGGMTYVKIAEWFDYNGYEYSKTYSLATMAVMHYLNEVVEMRNHHGDNVDPISDVFVFDVGGILLFSSDAVQRFFSETVVMTDWSGQPIFSLQEGTLSNHGQYFSFKWKLPQSAKWHLFYLAGVEGIAGLSYRNEDGTSFSAGAGVIGSRRTTVNDRTFEQSLILNWRAGFFYDRENSLLTSVYFSGMRSEFFKVNIYPSYFVHSGIAVGGVLIVSQQGKTTVGLTINWLPGISLSSH